MAARTWKFYLDPCAFYVAIVLQLGFDPSFERNHPAVRVLLFYNSWIWLECRNMINSLWFLKETRIIVYHRNRSGKFIALSRDMLLLPPDPMLSSTAKIARTLLLQENCIFWRHAAYNKFMGENACYCIELHTPLRPLNSKPDISQYRWCFVLMTSECCKVLSVIWKIPVVPHKAVAEVSRIGELLWCLDGRANPLRCSVVRCSVVSCSVVLCSVL